MKKTALLTALLCLAQSSLHADVPVLMNYQGKVADASGLPIGATGTAASYTAAPTNRKIIFRIYNVATGGTPLWAEEQTATLSSGVFSVLLGNGIAASGLAAGGSATLASEQAAHTDLSAVFAGKDPRFLEIVVNNGTGTVTAADVPVSPRQQITSTAFAFHAKVADSIASAADLTINPVTGTASNYGLGWYGTGRTFNSIAVDGPVLYGNAGGGLGSNVNGSKNLALLWNAAGNVGIGTTTPAYKLDINSGDAAGLPAFGAERYLAKPRHAAIVDSPPLDSPKPDCQMPPRAPVGSSSYSPHRSVRTRWLPPPPAGSASLLSSHRCP